METGKPMLFNRWDMEGIEVNDPGLLRYINLAPIVVPRSGGKFVGTQFKRNQMTIVERFMNKLMVPGHRGKRHKITSGHCVGQTQMLYTAIKKAFDIVEKRTKKNPIQVFIDAVVNAATFEEVTGYRVGGMIARKAVVTSPQRRVDSALRNLTQGIYKSSFKSKTKLPEVIANELIACANNDSKSHAVRERQRLEKEAESSR